MGWKTVPICDSCWIEQEGNRIPVRLLEEGGEYAVNTCYRCHSFTRGIYTRALVTGGVA